MSIESELSSTNELKVELMIYELARLLKQEQMDLVVGFCTTLKARASNGVLSISTTEQISDLMDSILNSAGRNDIETSNGQINLFREYLAVSSFLQGYRLAEVKFKNE